jgi:hypothetical protein
MSYYPNVFFSLEPELMRLKREESLYTISDEAHGAMVWLPGRCPAIFAAPHNPRYHPNVLLLAGMVLPNLPDGVVALPDNKEHFLAAEENTN